MIDYNSEYERNVLKLVAIVAFCVVVVVAIVSTTSLQKTIIQEQLKTEREMKIQDKKTERVDHVFPWSK